MAIPKRRLRWILLIVIVVMPATLTSVLIWFVASDTWLHSSSAVISRSLGMEAALEDLALAGSNRHQLSHLRLRDEEAQEHFHFTTLDAAGFVFDSKARLLKSEEWSWSLAANTDLVLLRLMQTCLATKTLTVVDLHEGQLGSLRVSLQYTEDAALKIQLSGAVDAPTRAAIADALHAQYFETALPAFITADTLYLDDLSLTFSGAQFHWADGACHLQFKDGHCVVQSFQDTRLPLFQVRDAQLNDGAFTDVGLSFDQVSQELALHFQTGEQHFALLILPQEHAVHVRVKQAQLAHADTPWAHYFDGHIADAFLPTHWDISGSSWEWRSAPATAQGALQLRGVTPVGEQVISMRGRWQFTDALLLEQVLFQLPGLSAVADIQLSDEKHFFLSKLQWLTVSPLLQKISVAYAAKQYHVEQEADFLRVFLMDADNDIRASYYANMMGVTKIELPSASADLVNEFAGKALMASGTMRELAYQEKAGAERQLQGHLKHARLSWPLTTWDVADAELHYQHTAQQETWRLQHANSDWRYHVSLEEQRSHWEIAVPLFDWRWKIHLRPNDMSLRVKRI